MSGPIPPFEEDPAKVQWVANTCKYLIVDGQHRYGALKKLADEKYQDKPLPKEVFVYFLSFWQMHPQFILKNAA